MFSCRPLFQNSSVCFCVTSWRAAFSTQALCIYSAKGSACLWGESKPVARLLCISEKLEESPGVGWKARTASWGVGLQPQGWEDNAPSKILRYETRLSEKSCLLLEHVGTSQDPAGTGLEETGRSLVVCGRDRGFWGVLFHAVIQCLDVPVVLDSKGLCCVIDFKVTC